MIYLIHADGTDYFKIGRSIGDGTNRLATLQTGCPHDLRLMAVADWPDSVEFRIHAFLTRRGKHVRGEWFKRCEHIDALWDAMESGNLENWLSYLSRVSTAPKRLAKVMALAA